MKSCSATLSLPSLALASIALAGALALHAGMAAAQSFPSRPVRMVVPYPPGGSTDVLARLISPKMSEAFGQPVVIENRPGAGGAVGAGLVAKSAPDGHTVLVIPNVLAIMPALYRKLQFDATKEFAPVSQLLATEIAIVASTKLEAGSVRELIALAKAKPGTLNVGTAGVATILHLTLELFKSSTGTDLTHVAYKGEQPLMTALLSGEVDLGVITVASSQAQIGAGRLRGIATTGAKRSAALPNVPTVAEGGVPGFESSSWQGMFAAAGTPRELLQRLQGEAARALKSPEVTERLPALGQEPVGSTPEEFDARFRSDVAKFIRIARDAKIPPQD